MFKDALALTIFDEDHSEAEERWVTLGQAASGKLLIVSHTFQEAGDRAALVRMIFARNADKHEQLWLFR